MFNDDKWFKNVELGIDGWWASEKNQGCPVEHAGKPHGATTKNTAFKADISAITHMGASQNIRTQKWLVSYSKWLMNIEWFGGTPLLRNTHMDVSNMAGMSPQIGDTPLENTHITTGVSGIVKCRGSGQQVHCR